MNTNVHTLYSDQSNFRNYETNVPNNLKWDWVVNWKTYQAGNTWISSRNYKPDSARVVNIHRRYTEYKR